MYEDMNYENMDKWITGDNSDASLTLLDAWFTSPVWRTVCTDAESGCSDSLELMETCSEFLRSLIFHLENDSGKSRVDYEMSLFAQLVEPYLDNHEG